VLSDIPGSPVTRRAMVFKAMGALLAAAGAAALYETTLPPCGQGLRERTLELVDDWAVSGGHAHVRGAPYRRTEIALLQLEQTLQMWRLRLCGGQYSTRRLASDSADDCGRDVPLDGWGDPIDGWGNPIWLERTPTGVRLTSWGPDGAPGGRCEADIVLDVLWPDGVSPR
jgi:hypothetical protein